MHAKTRLLSVASTLFAIIVAMTAYHFVGWIGVGIVGLAIMFVAIQAEMDEAIPISHFSTSTIVTTVLFQEKASRAENAIGIADRVATLKVTKVAKVIGFSIAVAGCIGFFLSRMP